MTDPPFGVIRAIPRNQFSRQTGLFFEFSAKGDVGRFTFLEVTTRDFPTSFRMFNEENTTPFSHWRRLFAFNGHPCKHKAGANIGHLLTYHSDCMRTSHASAHDSPLATRRLARKKAAWTSPFSSKVASFVSSGCAVFSSVRF